MILCDNYNIPPHCENFCLIHHPVFNGGLVLPYDVQYVLNLSVQVVYFGLVVDKVLAGVDQVSKYS